MDIAIRNSLKKIQGCTNLLTSNVLVLTLLKFNSAAFNNNSTSSFFFQQNHWRTTRLFITSIK